MQKGLKTFAEKAGFSVILCEKGVIYPPPGVWNDIALPV